MRQMGYFTVLGIKHFYAFQIQFIAPVKMQAHGNVVLVIDDGMDSGKLFGKDIAFAAHREGIE